MSSAEGQGTDGLYQDYHYIENEDIVAGTSEAIDKFTTKLSEATDGAMKESSEVADRLISDISEATSKFMSSDGFILEREPSESDESNAEPSEADDRFINKASDVSDRFIPERVPSGSDESSTESPEQADRFMNEASDTVDRFLTEDVSSESSKEPSEEADIFSTEYQPYESDASSTEPSEPDDTLMKASIEAANEFQQEFLEDDRFINELSELEAVGESKTKLEPTEADDEFMTEPTEEAVESTKEASEVTGASMPAPFESHEPIIKIQNSFNKKVPYQINNFISLFVTTSISPVELLMIDVTQILFIIGSFCLLWICDFVSCKSLTKPAYLSA